MAVIKVTDSVLKRLSLKKIHNDHRSLNQTIEFLLDEKEVHHGR